jgi:hypothetical protein
LPSSTSSFAGSLLWDPSLEELSSLDASVFSVDAAASSGLFSWFSISYCTESSMTFSISVFTSSTVFYSSFSTYV